MPRNPYKLAAYVTPELKNKVQQLAEQTNLSESKVIGSILARHLNVPYDPHIHDFSPAVEK